MLYYIETIMQGARMNRYCYYYHAYITRSQTWFFVATLRACEHMAFDRTLDKATGLFEIFVPEGYVKMFTQFMDEHQRQGVVEQYYKQPNRLRYEAL